MKRPNYAKKKINDKQKKISLEIIQDTDLLAK